MVGGRQGGSGPNSASWQKYVRGTIFYSPSFGATFICEWGAWSAGAGGWAPGGWGLARAARHRSTWGVEGAPWHSGSSPPPARARVPLPRLPCVPPPPLHPDPAAVAELWQSNQVVLGAPEKSSVPFPKANDASSCAAKKGLSGTMSYFAGGGIVFTVRGKWRRRAKEI